MTVGSGPLTSFRPRFVVTVTLMMFTEVHSLSFEGIGIFFDIV